MGRARIYASLAFYAGGCVLPAASQQPANPSPPGKIDAATEVLAGLTCAEMHQALRDKDKRAGPAILWLDAYYTRHAGLPDYTIDWAKTVAQGVGGTCAINVNASRTVLDVIAQMHREYGGANPVKP